MLLFLTKCVTNPRQPGHHCAARMNLAAEFGRHGPTRPPAPRPQGPKKRAGPSDQQRDLKRKNTEDITSKLTNRGCRAHELGRCVYTSLQCSAIHFGEPGETNCNSSIKEGNARYTNNKFGICRNFKSGG